MYRCNSRCCCSRNCNCNRSCSNVYENNCPNTNPFPENYIYGHAYTPVQTLGRTYTPEVGLSNGSIFPELVSSYCPGQSIDFIEFLKNGGIRNDE